MLQPSGPFVRPCFYCVILAEKHLIWWMSTSWKTACKDRGQLGQESKFTSRASNFYRAMHFSAKRGIAIACRLSVRLSVCPFDCDVGEL